MIPGIPTTYRGRIYRSRLEARWACMFDLLGWKYEYEPYDMKGWIPDFVIFARDEILVEVKPALSLKEFNIDKLINAIRDTDKWGKEILLLGFSLPDGTGELENSINIGWLCEFHQAQPYRNESATYKSAGANFTMRGEYASGYSKGKEGYGFCSDWASYICRFVKDPLCGSERRGVVDTGWRPNKLQIDDFEEAFKIRDLWARAGNQVQWKKKGR